MPLEIHGEINLVDENLIGIRIKKSLTDSFRKFSSYYFKGFVNSSFGNSFRNFFKVFFQAFLQEFLLGFQEGSVSRNSLFFFFSFTTTRILPRIPAESHTKILSRIPQYILLKFLPNFLQRYLYKFPEGFFPAYVMKFHLK